MISPTPSKFGRFAARFGAAAFLFFLIKGLLWLVIPAALVVFARMGLTA